MLSSAARARCAAVVPRLAPNRVPRGACVPVRRAESRERGHEIDPVAVGHRARERLDLVGPTDQPEPVAQPLDDRAADEDTALERVVDPRADLPGDRRDEAVVRFDRRAARVHHEKAPGAVGVLDHPGPHAHLAEQGGVLVARDAGQRDRRGEQRGMGHPVDLGRGPHLGQQGARNREFGQQFLIPDTRVNVEQHRARRVGHVGDVERPARQVPDEPTVDGAERELARLGARTHALDVVEDPADLGGREVGVDRQAGPRAYLRREAALLEFVAQARAAPVLPDDRVVDRLAALAVPDHGRFALVGDADRGDLARTEAGPRDRLGRDACLRRPDLARVMLDPARVRIDLAEFLLGTGDHRTVRVEDNRARTRGALVEREDMARAVGAGPVCHAVSPCGPIAGRKSVRVKVTNSPAAVSPGLRGGVLRKLAGGLHQVRAGSPRGGGTGAPASS